MSPRDAAQPNSRTGTGGDSAGSAVQRAYDTLRQQIVSMSLPPGTVLSRPELAKRFGVSQTPIREALQKLEQDGLIRIFPQSRTLVRRIDIKQLYETHFLRVAVECEVIRRLALHPQEEALKRARAIVKMQEVLIGQLDQMDLFNEQDRNFHRTLFEAAGVGSTYDLLAAQTGHLLRCQRLDLPKKGKMTDIVADHEAILEAIEAGNVEHATEAMRRHLSGTIKRVETLRRENPDFFTEDTVELT
ncbi:GntR family transcriptional regulator [Seohaeicola saemankumensis]|nr:GntR family transcriptional regulator [Seohaeicola saemankumensis]